MLVELVQVVTKDGVKLHGALETPSSGAEKSSPIDAWLCIHGTGSNFYAASTLAALAPKLLATGAPVLRGNTRGHDLIATGPSTAGRPYLGAAFERVDEAPLDLAAWIDFLRQRGFQRIGLLGHSLGAVKSIFTLAGEGRDEKRTPPDVAALVAISPPRLSHEWICQSPKRDEFLAALHAAEELIRAGRGEDVMKVKLPLAYYVTASGYVDRYGPHEKYNVLKLIGRVAAPTLFTFGTIEMQELAFRGMPEALEPLATPANRLQVAVVAGADHIYSGCQDVLAGRITAWAARLAASAG